MARNRFHNQSSLENPCLSLLAGRRTTTIVAVAAVESADFLMPASLIFWIGLAAVGAVVAAGFWAARRRRLRAEREVTELRLELERAKARSAIERFEVTQSMRTLERVVAFRELHTIARSENPLGELEARIFPYDGGDREDRVIVLPSRRLPEWEAAVARGKLAYARAVADDAAQGDDAPVRTKIGARGTEVEQWDRADSDDEPRSYEDITVFYATDRTPASKPVYYGSGRSDLHYGQCRVTVPTQRQIGTIPRPGFLLRLIRVEVKSRHVIIHSVDDQTRGEFVSELRAAVNATPEKQALVFVHGFNVTFADAVYRTAQITVDLEFDGPAVLYSWPSVGELTPTAYTYDQEQAIWTLRHLRPFLELVADETGAERIHLLAHSMGNQSLTAALLQLAPTLRRRPAFHELVLTAPDIDADVFCNDIAPAILGVARRSTLYASSRDIALGFSRSLHGYPRAGDSGDEILLVDGMDSVDVSAVSTDFLGHGYYGSNDSVLSDMHYLIKGLKVSDRHRLRQKSRGSQPYWEFRP